MCSVVVGDSALGLGAPNDRGVDGAGDVASATVLFFLSLTFAAYFR